MVTDTEHENGEMTKIVQECYIRITRSCGVSCCLECMLMLLTTADPHYSLYTKL